MEYIPVNEEEFWKAKPGQWLRVHWLNAQPTWVLFVKMSTERTKFVEIYFPMKAMHDLVSIKQISFIGDLVLEPK